MRPPSFTPCSETVADWIPVVLKKNSRIAPAIVAGLLVLGVVLLMDFALKQVGQAWQSARAPLPATPKADSRVAHRHFSKEYHHGFVPLKSGRETYGPFSADYFINSLGMRDQSPRQVSPEKPKAGRILLLGDSFIDGVGVNFPETVAGRLSKKLSPQGVEVLNGGVASYCPTLMEARLRLWILRDRLSFDQALVFIDLSDLRDEWRYRQEPSGTFLETDSHEFEDAVREDERQTRPFRLWMESKVEKNFVLLGALLRNLRLLYEAWGSPGSTMPFDPGSWPSYQGPLEPWIRKSLVRQAAAMDGILALCRQEKASLTIVVYPGRPQVEAEKEEDRHTVFWKNWAASRGVSLISLYPDFLQIRNQLDTYLLGSQDSHWNARGSQFVAEAVWEKMNRPSGRVPENPKASKSQAGKQL